MIFTSLLAALAATPLASAGALGRPSVFPNGLDVLNGPLLQNLPSQGQHNDKWGAGWLPETCRDAAKARGVNPNDMEAHNVYYDDCDSSWVICRQKTAQLSKDAIIDYFGRLPVGMRDYVRHLIAFAADNKSAVSSGNTITFNGNCPFTVFVHETGHNLDSWAFGDEFRPFSASQLWLTEYNKDTAVPDNYATTSQAENVSQGIVVALADKNIPGGIGTITPSWNLIFHQYATIQWKLGTKLYQGGWCSRKWQNSAPVATRRRRDGEAPRSIVTGDLLDTSLLAKSAIHTWFDDNGRVIRSEVTE